MASRATTGRTRARHAAERSDRLRAYLFGAIAVGVLAVGGFLAFGSFFTRPPAEPGAISIQSSMAGFTPSEIHVKAGTTVVLDWWTDDAAIHLDGGVHTMISPALGLDETLHAQSRRSVVWTVPDQPGTYDVYCDSCCGGQANPEMHGKIVVEPNA